MRGLFPTKVRCGGKESRRFRDNLMIYNVIVLILTFHGMSFYEKKTEKKPQLAFPDGEKP